MIRSMTGFGVVEKSNKDFSIEFRFRSVNNRFFDSNIKLPHLISFLEQKIYNLLKDNCKRGTIHINCKLKINNNKISSSKIDKNKLEYFYNYLRPIEKKFSESNFKLNLSFDDILDKISQDNQDFNLLDKNKKFILNAFNLGLKDLLQSRKIEGKKIEKEIKDNIKKLNTINSKIIRLETKNKKEHFDNYKKRIKLVLADLNLTLEDNKLYKELSLFSDKYDISEETSRIDYHLEQFSFYVKNEDYPGKKINFLCQELFREINTIGSKAGNQFISILVVDFKTYLEKIREQVQNIL